MWAEAAGRRGVGLGGSPSMLHAAPPLDVPGGRSAALKGGIGCEGLPGLEEGHAGRVMGENEFPEIGRRAW